MHVRRVSIVFVALLFATACAEKAETQAITITIGLEAPISGEQSSNGVDQLRGAQLAVDEANAAGGVLGRRVELIQIDDKASPVEGKRVATDAVAKGIFAVVGPYNSSVGVANLSIYLKAGVIPIHMTSNSKTNKMGFTVQPKDYQIAPIEARAISGYYRAKKVAIVYDPSTYTEGIASQLRDDLAKADVSVVAYESVTPGKSSYLDLLKEIKAKGPDLFYASTYYPEGGLIAKERAAIKLPGACLMGLANQDPNFIKTAGLAAARECSSSGVPAPAQFKGATKYVSDYVARFNAEPGTWGTFTYDSVKLLFDAVARAKEWKAAPVRRELTATTAYTGLTGTIAIDPATGNRVNVPVVILKIAPAGGYEVDRAWASFAHFVA